MSVLQNQPLFKINVETYGTKHIININGVSVITDLDKDGQSETTLPINHLMRSGLNSIDIYIFPDKPNFAINANSRAKVTLTVTSNTNPDKVYNISNIDFQGINVESKTSTERSSRSGKLDSTNNFNESKDGDTEVFDIKINDVSSYKGGIKITRELFVPSSLPLWAFFDSDTLPNYDALSDDEYYNEIDKLLTEYLKIHNAILTRDIESVVTLFEERNSELDAAFYQPKGTYDKKIFNSLLDASNDENLELVELKKEHVNFTVEDNKKLTSLTRGDFSPAIALNFKTGTGSQNYPLIFRLTNGKWILTR